MSWKVLETILSHLIFHTMPGALNNQKCKTAPYTLDSPISLSHLTRYAYIIINYLVDSSNREFGTFGFMLYRF